MKHLWKVFPQLNITFLEKGSKVVLSSYFSPEHNMKIINLGDPLKNSHAN